MMGSNNNNNNMKLKRILGFTTNSRNSFVSQPNTGNIVYIAGCIVVLFNPETRVQQYLISESKQTITTLAISDDGKYLATADCGQKVTIRIWNLFGHTTSLASPVEGDKNSSIKSSNNQIQQQPTIEASFNGHNIEVTCMSFSANNEILVSVGSQQDLTLNIWDWKRGLKLATNKLTTKVRSITFSSDSSYFVTAGEAHLKYWYIKLLSTNELSPSTGEEGSCQVEGGQYEVNSINEASSISISCRSATLGSNFKEGSFCDVKCSRRRRQSKEKGDKNPDSCDDDDDDDATGDKTFCITKQGLLCELNEKRLLHKWVDLRTSSANCLAVGKNLIVIGCANGVVRCFSTNELRFLKNLPRPHQIGTDIANKKQTSNHQSGLANYSSIISVGLDETTKTISCIYNDRSIYVWNLEDEFRVISKKYSALYHSSCIWGIDVYPHSSSHTQHSNKRHTNSQQQQQQQYVSLLPEGSFVTCSSDDTLRIWRTGTTIDGGLDEESGAQTVIYSDNVYSDELIKIIFTDSAYKFLCDLDCVENLDGGGQENKSSTQHTNYDSNEGLRCLKLSPDGKHLSVGSRSGTIRVFDFAQDRELKSIAAHDAEVLCLEYSDPTKFDGYYYLASSSRDKLIHLFDASREYKFLQTIDDHSSSITALRFVNNRTDDCLQLISCGTDQKIVFRNGHPFDHTHTQGRQNNGEAGQQQQEEEKQLNFVTERLVEGKTTFYDMEVDSESSCLMTACQDRMIRLFNVAQVKYQSGFKGSNSDEGTIIKLALDPSCTFLAASCTDKSVSIYDYQRGESVATISQGLSDLVTDMKFSLDGRHLIACSGNGCIFIWSSPAEVANASSCLTTDHQHQSSVPTTANRVAHSKTSSSSVFQSHQADPMADWRSPYSLKKSTTQVSEHQQMTANNNEYQVQNISNSKTINNNEAAGDDDDDHDDEDDDQRTLRGDDSVASPSSLIRSKFHSEILDDDGQLSQRYARSQRSTTSSRRSARESANGANGSMGSNMAKYFQSRENLDKISSRQRYIHDSLFNSNNNNNNNSSASQRSSRNNASLSGRFVGQEENSRKVLQDHHHSNGTPTTSRAATSALFASRAKSLSRLSSSIVGQRDGQRSSSKGIRRRANSSGDELSSANDDEDVDYSHEPSAKNYGTNQKFATLNASGHQQNKITTRHMSSNSHYGTLGSIINQTTTKTATKTSSTSELRSSHATTTGVDEQAMLALGQQQQQSVHSAYGEETRLDLTEVDPNRVHISRELCQQVVEELRVISKFATRLHRRLHSSGSKNLANYVSRGVQNSLDILSIVPPRALTQQQQQQQQQQFRSQIDLSIGGGDGGSCRQSTGINGGQSSSSTSTSEVKYMNQLHASGAQTIGRREVIRPQNVAPAVTPAIRRRSSLGSGSSSMAANVIGSPASEAIESTLTTTTAATTVADRAGMMPSQVGNSNSNSNRDSNSSGNSSSKRQSSLADHQGQVEDNHSSIGHGSKDFVRSSPQTAKMLATTTSAKVFEAKQQSSPNNSNKNAQLNIDQVLEAYSDRLFKMVQQRMEWSVAVDNNAAAAASSSSSPPLPSSAASSSSLLSRELANNKQTTTTNGNTKQR